MNKENQKIINFNKDDLKFLLLNILGHDVIHDFYGNLGKERWNKVNSLASKFKSSYTMSGGTETETITLKRRRDDTDSDSEYKPKRVFVNNGSNIHYLSDSPYQMNTQKKSFDNLGEGIKLGEKTTIYDLFNDKEYSNFCTDIGNDIQFKLFYVVANMIYNNKVNNSNEVLNITVSHDFFIPNDLKKSDDSDNTPELNSKLYSVLRDRFIDYYFDYFIDNTNDNAMEIDSDNTNVYPDITYTDMFNLLYNFITDEYYFSYTIYNFLINNENQIGGDNSELTPEENGTFVSEMNEKKKEMEQTNGLISDIANIFLTKNEKIDDKIRKYEMFKRDILAAFKAIIRKYSQETLAGGFDNFALPTFDKATKLINLKDEINAQYNKLMKSYHDIDKKERAKLAGSTLKIRSAAYDVKESFAFMILKGSLYLTECVDKYQKPIILDTISQEQKDLITKQINIINEIISSNFISDEQKSTLAEICSTIKLNDEFILPYIKEYIIFQTVLNLNQNIDYDGFLIDFIKEFFKNYEYTNESEQRYECIDVNDKYVINNASNLLAFSKRYLNNEIFCPYSSIVDAMPQCKYNDSLKKQLLEYGDINFKLFNSDSNMYYNGISQIVEDDKNIFSKTILDIKLPLLTINSEINVKVNYNGRSQLSAEDSLRTTLLDMIEFVNVQERPVLDKIFREKQIFENLYAMAVQEETDFQTGAEKSKINYNYSNFKIDPNVNANLNIFSVVFNKILIKGTGDLYQEINSVCKYGGYVGNNYYCDEKILSYNNETGNQTRFFAANDRPSASRFIFIICNGDENEVNTKSMGGYVSGSTSYIVSKYTNPKNSHPNPCEIELQTVSQTGGVKHKKSKRNIKIKNKKTKNKKIKIKNKNKNKNTIKRKHKKHNKTRRIK
jgi:hypothetical protein